MAVDPLERLTNLVALLLATPQPLTLEEITDGLRGQYPDDPVARRGAFERDKRVLREEGIPIDLVPGERGGTRYRIERSLYELPELGLTDDERTALALAVATVELGEAWGAHALAKVGDGGAEPEPGPLAVLAAPDALPTLFAAQTERRAVAFAYRGQRRTVDGYGLLARGGFWYLVGREHESAELRTYRVDRVDGTVEPLGRPGVFAVPAGFDPSAALPADPMLLGEGEAADARVLVDAARSAAVVAELGDDAVVERRADGAVVVGLPVRNRGAFRSWVLGLLDHAEVLGPPPLRDDVVAWLEAVAR